MKRKDIELIQCAYGFTKKEAEIFLKNKEKKEI